MAKKRTIVGSPLTPSLLRELGAMDNFPPDSGDFKPAGDWVNTYRIWTCHGYRQSSNQDVGFVRIERVGGFDDTFTLNVHQEVAETDAMIYILDGSIKCRDNPLASPLQWDLKSRFSGADGKEISQLSSRDRGAADEVSDRLTGDWCLFEAVQRLAFDGTSSYKFDLLEAMRLCKAGHRLFYRGAIPWGIAGEERPLYCFVQLGSGILPTEYWLDAHHRLTVVTSMNKAYILDDQAENVVSDRRKNK